jgi:hypothetical protein
MVEEGEDSGAKLGRHSLVHERLRGGGAVEVISGGSFEFDGAVLGVRGRETGVGYGGSGGRGGRGPFL